MMTNENEISQTSSQIRNDINNQLSPTGPGQQDDDNSKTPNASNMRLGGNFSSAVDFSKKRSLRLRGNSSERKIEGASEGSCILESDDEESK